ncbi:MAG: alkaline phosphatase family protein [Pyrinomonadaceae bacterium]|nr:alkaline phosphatase family protein [Pyrinomonadaceae bacterium]MBP9110536.1 alkaline phosphatase family protein [Pyrinomonadaceae bacterium]
MTFRHASIRLFLVTFLVTMCCLASSAQGVKRVVIVKIDGLPGHYVDRFVKQVDPKTGKSILPWFEEVFYRNGTRVPNFYTRGMSLSGPSWGQLDTGQRLQIKGNVEYDRYTGLPYDYLNFIPFYLEYGLSNRRADMPAAEVMDQLKIPLLSDAFEYRNRYTSQQLYQRGNNWEVLGSGFVNMFPRNAREFIDEWTMGFEFRKVTIGQAERDILGKLVKRPDIDYFDYYDVSFDHMSHHNNDTASRVSTLKELDGLIGRIWMAIQNSSRAQETALILVSDHGFNSDPKAYSQGFNLVKVLGSAAGGGHHTVTKRRLMLDYSVKGLYPLVPLIKTNAQESFYLRDQSSKYPTALLDFDGNERSSIHLRNSDLNLLHILLQQLKGKGLNAAMRAAATDAFFDIIERHRGKWSRTSSEITEEIEALRRWISLQEKIVAALPKKFTPEEMENGLDKEARRSAGHLDTAIGDEREYRKYVGMLNNLLSLRRENFDARKVKIEEVILPGSMGDPNTVYQLQNYIVGISQTGLILNTDKDLDLDRSFVRVNYFDLLRSQRVRNNVQAGVSNRPIDFVAVRLPGEPFRSSNTQPDENPIWVYGDNDKQVIIHSRTDDNGAISYRYQSVSGLRQNADGSVVFKEEPVGPGFPLGYFEDPDFAIPADERAAWLSTWHTETEWMAAVHKTKYSNALIGLNEQLDRHPVFASGETDVSADEGLLRRFRQRQREVTEADLLILANDRWNFDVRGFNPGGNHGSFFRISTNSTFMIAGGRDTGIPRGLAVEQPYDSLSFVPTVLRLMGKIDENNRPSEGLAGQGFRRFPGRVITEVIGSGRQEEKR